METLTLNQHVTAFRQAKHEQQNSFSTKTTARRKRIGILYSSSWINDDFENTKRSYTSHKNQVINNFTRKITDGFLHKDKEQIKNCCKNFLREIN